MENRIAPLAMISAVALCGCGQESSPTTALIYANATVLVCWQGETLIDPHECVDRQVTAIKPLGLSDQSARFEATEGKIASLSVADAVRGMRSDHPSIYFAYRLLAKPVPPGELARLDLEDYLDTPNDGTSGSADPWAHRLPIFVADGAASDVPMAAAWHGKRFSDAATTEKMAGVIRDVYGAEVSPVRDEYTELAWLDIDGDGLEEAITIVSETSSPCHDLVVFAFDSAGSIRNADQIRARKRRGPCMLDGFPFDIGDWWTFMIVPWPASDRGLALLLEVGTGGGDNFEHYVLPLDGLLEEPKASAVFVASFIPRSDIPSE